ncbi:hypothetical protein ACWGB8_07995 [Kitasatospora sp. NPDC054939]
MSCNQWVPSLGRHCGRASRPYGGVGERCSLHTPAAERGQPEPPPGPGYTPQRLPTPQSASALVDARAVASGKRRSSGQDFRLAQAATGRAPTPSTTSTRRTA